MRHPILIAQGTCVLAYLPIYLSMVVPIYAHTVVTAGCCAPLCKSTCAVQIHITRQRLNGGLLCISTSLTNGSTAATHARCNLTLASCGGGDVGFCDLVRGGMWVSETLLWVSETLLLSLCRRPTPSWLLLAEKICWHDVPCPVLARRDTPRHFSLPGIVD